MTKTWPVLDETLKEMFITTDEYEFTTKCILKIADLGCSSGPNTLLVISHIIEQLSKLQEHAPREIQVFLNDLPDNDFNNLFKLMSTNTNTNTKNNIECYIYGAPGSFYGRLFPNSSLHFAYSSYSLHWLSRIPQGLEKNNKENICIATTSPPQVFEAYSNQFKRDFMTFLKLRGEEIRGGGRMVLGFIGRSVADPTSKDELKTITLLSETLSDMVAEGLVKEEDLHSFNIPIYAPSIQEISTAIESEGSFNLDKMEVVLVPLDANEDDNNYDNMVSNKNNTSGKFVANYVRAFAEPMLVAHFGSSINVDVVFDVYAKKTDEHLSVERSSYFTPVISLTRKTMTD
ncbi:hypothetical protein MIMGU_mgv1a009362mg [Erythranthe guttata]|uniref:Uncharacterized protein n=1 Tax=Erythranthe guttata TaxID=4155 RepID=A0A022RJA4_ERYGU|nr:hypothetical protein MIMGU_mgv1a009362mg [Erythranthe guttata]